MNVFKITRNSINKSQHLKRFFNESVNIYEKIHIIMKDHDDF